MNRQMSLELNARETALVLIDLQRAVVSRELKPHTAASGGAFGEAAEAVRAAGGSVIYVHVQINETCNCLRTARPRPDGQIPPEASELVPEAVFATATRW